MRMPVLRSSRETALPGVTGTARLDRRTKMLVRRVKPGDIAVIDHVDLDQASARALVDAGVAAVVNVSPSTSGRYPNLGPQVIIDAGIPLIDATRGPVFSRLRDGDRVRVHEGLVYRDETEIGAGIELDATQVAGAAEAARAGMMAQLETFSANAMEFLRREGDLLLDGAGVPATRTDFDGRAVVVVTKAYDYRQDLRRLRRFIRDRRPVLVGVDAGAEALRSAGHTPHVIIGDVDTVGDATLRCGAEVIVRAPRDGRPAGLERLERLGVTSRVFRTSGTSEDAAALLADTGGAALVIAVGSNASLEEYLDMGRSGMASTFVTRLRVGPTLVDARAVQRLYSPPVRTWQVLLLAVLGLLAVAVAVAATPVGERWIEALVTAAAGVWSDLRGPG